ncbi:hypothetical protein OZX68_04910 [Streptococcaceae bacterium ESL0729]|nr:hypothetical protein OZX68_04910 [Streptococcaceae bacterium ESL0729]
MNNINRRTIQALARILLEDLPSVSILRLMEEGNFTSYSGQERRLTSNRQRRLEEAIIDICDYSKSPYPVLKLIEQANYPGLYALKEASYLEDRLDRINEILALEGYLLRVDGRISGPELKRERRNSKLRLEKLKEALNTHIINQRVEERLTKDYLLYNYYGLVSSLGADLFDHLREISQSKLYDQALINLLLNPENPVLVLKETGALGTSKLNKELIKELAGDLKQVQKIYRPSPNFKEDRYFDFSNRQDTINILLVISNIHDQLDQAYILEKLVTGDLFSQANETKI